MRFRPHSRFAFASVISLAGLLAMTPFMDDSAAVVPASVVAADTAASGEVAALAESGSLASRVNAVVNALQGFVTEASHPRALASAVNSYLSFRQAHPDQVKKPFLYFIDLGLRGSTPRGYVFDMDSLSLVDGPFMVAHGRGSAKTGNAVPTKFSNANGSAASSLGLYLTQELYAFSGKAGGRRYSSTGLRMTGLSDEFNDKARERGVVVHGAPYVTARGAGRSEGCPAMDQARAARLLPKIADGALVFVFAPKADWMTNDGWVTAE